ncbi:Chromodomain-helicase-DNA-binding protein 7, partial [Orchesella cincta]
MDGSTDGFGTGNSQQQQPTRPGAADNMMQGFGNQTSQYAPMGQGMTPTASKLTPGYPDFTSQYGAYNPSTVQQQQPQPTLGAYGAAPGTPSRPMAGYPPYHQSAAAPSMHYQDYAVQSQAGMLRPTAPPTQPHAPQASRMVSPAAPPPPQQQQQQQQQYGAYRAPAQESMYVQQLQRWNEQQQPYGASLPHHYPANAAATYRPPHAYPSNLPRPPQPINQQSSIPQQQPQASSASSAAAVNSQQPTQHNIPYMTRPQTPSVLNQQQSQYTQNMYPNASNQYPDYHHNSAGLNRMASGPPAAPSNVYPTASHHTQQPYSMPTAPQPHQPYGNQYGQYYPTGNSQVPGAQGSSMSYSAAYGSNSPAVNSSVPNGNASYRPGYAQLPQLSPRQPTPSPRQPTPSPRPPAATTPTIPVSSSPVMSQQQQQQQNSMPQQQQQQQQQLPPVPPQQNQQPSSLQQLEQMVMPHVSKSSPSPKPQMGNMGGGGVMSPLGGPKTPMSPNVSGPKTPMSPTQWQTPSSRPTQPPPPPVSKTSYPSTPQPTPSVSGSPGGYSISSGVLSPMQNSSSNIDNTINSIVRGSQDPSDLDLGNLSSMDTSSECPLPASISREDTKSNSQLSSGIQPQNTSSDLGSLPMNDDASSGATSEMSTSESMGQPQSNSVQSNDTGFSLPGSSLHDSAIDSDGTNGLPSLGSSMDDSQTSQSQVPNSSSAVEQNVPSSMSNALNSMSPSSSSQTQQQQQMSSTFTSPTSLGSPMAMSSNAPSSQSSQQQPQQMGLPPSSQPSMQVSNMINSYSPGPQQHVQTSQGYVNSPGMSSASTSMGGMMPPPGPHQYSSQRFPGPDVSGASQSYMGGYHNAPGYPQYGQSGVHQGQMRPPGGPSPYSVGGVMGPISQGMPNQNATSTPTSDRYFEIHQLQQQLQHLYSLPPNPQTQMQINELQERLRMLQQQQQQQDGMSAAGSYPMQSMQPPMGGMPNPAQIYGPGPNMQMPQGIPGADMPKTDLDETPTKQKKKKERKPRESKAGKGKKSKEAKELANLDQPPNLDVNQMSHEVYDFQDLPPELPEKKPKKPRKPREAKPPKEKKPKEPKPPKEKTPKSSKARKKKGQVETPELSSSSQQGEPVSVSELDPLAPKADEFPEPDQKNGIGAAGIIAAEGGPSVPTCGGDGDTSTQDGTGVTETIDAEAVPVAVAEVSTPVKPKKPKKPKLKSSSSSKKRPSKTMISLAKLKKRRKRSDSEGSDLDATPPPSPPPEDDNSNKRRSARNTGRKKYIDDIDLALSDEELLMPNKAALKTLEAVISESAAEAASAAVTTDIPPIDGSEPPPPVEPQPAPAPTPTPKKGKKAVQETPPPETHNMNKPNFVFVNPADEDTMIVQHILSMRMGKREIIHDSSSEDEDEEKPDESKEKTEAGEVQSEDTEKKISEEAVSAEISESSEIKKEEVEDEDKNSTKVDDSTKPADESVDETTTKGQKKEEESTSISEDANKEDNLKMEDSEVVGKSVEEVNNSKDPESKDVVEPNESVKSDELDKPVKDDTETECKPENSEADNKVVPTEETEGKQVASTIEDESDKKEVTEKTDTEKKSEDVVENSDKKEVSEENAENENKTESKEEEKETPSDGSNDKKPKKEKKKREPEVIDVEEFYVKYKSFSYLHCEWKTEEELLKGDKRVNGKIKRFKQKLNQNSNIFEFLEEEPFNPDYIEKRPKPQDWVKLDKSPVYNNNNTLREYQLEGLNWLSFSWFNGRNCILADEMGLGKTIQSLTFVESVHRYGIRGPFLILAPLSTVPNWQREFETWTDLNIIVYHGSVASRNMIQEYEMFYRHPDNPQMNIKDVYKFNVLITTFEIVLTDVMELKDLPWRLCIIDEAHRLKNKNCKLLEGLRMLNLEHRVLLSGTPLQNNVNELFSLLNFLEPAQFSSDEHFSNEFGELKSESQVQKLQLLLKPMMLRRLKEDVEKSIAPKQETIIEVELTNMQKKYYRAILEKNFSFLSKGTNSSNIPNLMNTMMELRKCCIHPYLLNGAEEQIQLDYRVVNDVPESDPDLYYKALVSSSGKMVLIDKLLPRLKANGHRVLVFSQMVRCLDILEDYLIYRKYPYERLDGRIRGPIRQAAIDRFSKPDSDRFVFLLCTKAGGLGINLTAADTVIIYDSDWNPQNDLQAQARCHRIGQAKMVKIYRLVCRNTYEREMFDRASLKLGLDKAVLQSMNTSQGSGKAVDPSNKQLSKKEVEDLLKRGAYGALMDDDKAGDNFCEEDIDCILQRRTQIITLEQGEKGSTFSKASFTSTGARDDIDIDDPNFWQKWARKAEIDVDELGEK